MSKDYVTWKVKIQISLHSLTDGPLIAQENKLFSFKQKVFIYFLISPQNMIEPAHDKSYNKTFVTSKDSDQPANPPSMAKVLIYPS